MATMQVPRSFTIALMLILLGCAHAQSAGAKCKDISSYCKGWKAKGWCKDRPYGIYQIGSYWCPKTCNMCKGCYDYAAAGYCRRWKPYCKKTNGVWWKYSGKTAPELCPKTCGVCK